MPKTRTLRGTFDQTGHIGHHEALARTHTNHTQIGVQGGERIIGNFGAGIGDGRDQGGLARIGHPQKAHIGQDLELEFDESLFTQLAGCFLSWRAVDGALKAHIAKSTLTSLGHHDELTWCQELVQDFACFGVCNDGAHRHFENNVISCSTKHVRTHAMLPALGLMAPGKTEIHQGIETHIGHGIDVATATAVSTIGAAKFFVLFMTK